MTYSRFFFSSFLLGLFFIGTNTSVLFAQGTGAVIEQTQQDIAYINSLLDITNQSKTASVNQLLLLKKQVINHSSVISGLTQEINLIDVEIQTKQFNIAELERYLKDLMAEYEKMIYYAYLNKDSYQLTMFILSSDDFNQAYKRLKYLQQYTLYRKEQVVLITEKKQELQDNLAQLEAEKLRKQQLVLQKQGELVKLANARLNQQTIVSQLEGQKNDLVDDYYQQIAQDKTLDQQVSQTISSSSQSDPLTQRFSTYKGLLGWPVRRGVVIGEFGQQPHSYLDGVFVVNNGIDISTDINSEVMSIFEGKVAKVVSIPGANKSILISHGEYFTLYSNLADVSLKAGDKVQAQQVIGHVYTNPTDKTSVLKFQVWHGDSKLNPINWLQRR